MKIVSQNDDYVKFSIPGDVLLDLRELISSSDQKKLIDYADSMEKLYGHKD
ncbi:MAG: hypothetical protein V7K22_17435 [Nostoc sp.]